MRGFLGIDWGTHSSKWAYQTEDSALVPVVGSIWDSSVASIDDSLAWFPADERSQEGKRETALKRKLIQDPDQPFWEGIRSKLGVTLGEAVVFSLLALLLDAENVLAKRRKELKNSSLTVRFSHPNWIDENNIGALAYFRDAAVVALSIFMEGIECEVAGGIRIRIANLREAVRKHRQDSLQLVPFPGSYAQPRLEPCLQGKLQGADWSLVFESCAAGFPYLVKGESDLHERGLRKVLEIRRVRKILVVDIGAGSTDAGYMLRIMLPKDPRTGEIEPQLMWLPAANALEVAGRWLTDKILADLRLHRRRVSEVEAEEYKLGSPQFWADKHYLHDWNSVISDHVAEYVRTITDEKYIKESPPLDVVVTGGSSAVSSVKETVLHKVQQTLRFSIGLSEDFASKTKLLSPDLEEMGLSCGEVELAQRAVSLGASHPSLSKLLWYPGLS